MRAFGAGHADEVKPERRLERPRPFSRWRRRKLIGKRVSEQFRDAGHRRLVVAFGEQHRVASPDIIPMSGLQPL